MDRESGACSAIPIFQRPAHAVNQFARNRQAQPATLTAGCIERFEEVLARFRRYTRSRIVDVDQEPAAVPGQVQVDESSFRYGGQCIQN